MKRFNNLFNSGLKLYKSKNKVRIHKQCAKHKMNINFEIGEYMILMNYPRTCAWSKIIVIMINCRF